MLVIKDLPDKIVFRHKKLPNQVTSANVFSLQMLLVKNWLTEMRGITAELNVVSS